MAIKEKQQILSVFEDLVNDIWERMADSMGKLTVQTLFERTIQTTTNDFAFLKRIEITNKGVDFSQLYSNIEKYSSKQLDQGLRTFIANFIEFITMLTGNILVESIQKDMDETLENLKEDTK